jgi:hypothetical protein
LTLVRIPRTMRSSSQREAVEAPANFLVAQQF